MCVLVELAKSAVHDNKGGLWLAMSGITSKAEVGGAEEGATGEQTKRPSMCKEQVRDYREGKKEYIWRIKIWQTRQSNLMRQR